MNFNRIDFGVLFSCLLLLACIQIWESWFIFPIITYCLSGVGLGFLVQKHSPYKIVKEGVVRE